MLFNDTIESKLKNKILDLFIKENAVYSIIKLKSSDLKTYGKNEYIKDSEVFFSHYSTVEATYDIYREREIELNKLDATAKIESKNEFSIINHVHFYSRFLYNKNSKYHRKFFTMQDLYDDDENYLDIEVGKKNIPLKEIKIFITKDGSDIFIDKKYFFDDKYIEDNKKPIVVFKTLKKRKSKENIYNIVVKTNDMSSDDNRNKYHFTISDDSGLCTDKVLVKGKKFNNETNIFSEKTLYYYDDNTIDFSINELFKSTDNNKKSEVVPAIIDKCKIEFRLYVKKNGKKLSRMVIDSKINRIVSITDNYPISLPVPGDYDTKSKIIPINNIEFYIDNRKLTSDELNKIKQIGRASFLLDKNDDGEEHTFTAVIYNDYDKKDADNSEITLHDDYYMYKLVGNRFDKTKDEDDLYEFFKKIYTPNSNFDFNENYIIDGLEVKPNPDNPKQLIISFGKIWDNKNKKEITLDYSKNIKEDNNGTEITPEGIYFRLDSTSFYQQNKICIKYYSISKNEFFVASIKYDVENNCKYTSGPNKGQYFNSIDFIKEMQKKGSADYYFFGDALDPTRRADPNDFVILACAIGTYMASDNVKAKPLNMFLTPRDKLKDKLFKKIFDKTRELELNKKDNEFYNIFKNYGKFEYKTVDEAYYEDYGDVSNYKGIGNKFKKLAWLCKKFPYLLQYYLEELKLKVIYETLNKDENQNSTELQLNLSNNKHNCVYNIYANDNLIPYKFKDKKDNSKIIIDNKFLNKKNNLEIQIFCLKKDINNIVVENKKIVYDINNPKDSEYYIYKFLNSKIIKKDSDETYNINNLHIVDKSDLIFIQKTTDNSIKGFGESDKWEIVDIGENIKYEEDVENNINIIKVKVKKSYFDTKQGDIILYNKNFLHTISFENFKSPKVEVLKTIEGYPIIPRGNIYVSLFGKRMYENSDYHFLTPEKDKNIGVSAIRIKRFDNDNNNNTLFITFSNIKNKVISTFDDKIDYSNDYGLIYMNDVMQYNENYINIFCRDKKINYSNIKQLTNNLIQLESIDRPFHSVQIETLFNEDCSKGSDLQEFIDFISNTDKNKDKYLTIFELFIKELFNFIRYENKGYNNIKSNDGLYEDSDYYKKNNNKNNYDPSVTLPNRFQYELMEYLNSMLPSTAKPKDIKKLTVSSIGDDSIKNIKSNLNVEKVDDVLILDTSLENKNGKKTLIIGGDNT